MITFVLPLVALFRCVGQQRVIQKTRPTRVWPFVAVIRLGLSTRKVKFGIVQKTQGCSDKDGKRWRKQRELRGMMVQAPATLQMGPTAVLEAQF